MGRASTRRCGWRFPEEVRSSKSELSATALNKTFIETGLKAVDLFAPVPLGGDILVTGEPKAGARIVGTELACRFARRPGEFSGVTAFLDPAVADAEDYAADFKDAIPADAELISTERIPAERIRQVGGLSAPPLGNVVFAFSHRTSYLDAFRQAVRSARFASPKVPLTAFAITEGLSPGGFDARLVLSRALAAEAVYPAFDVVGSTSNARGLGEAAPDHAHVAKSAREAIARVLSKLRPGGINDPAWEGNANPAERPAVQALVFLSQPLFCAEGYTGMASAIVPVAETVTDFRTILEGRYTDHAAARFRFLNGLDGQLVDR